MIVKELWAVLRDPRGRIILVVPPIIQLVLFASAATLEVTNADIGILDHDNGPAAHEFIQQLAGARNIRVLVPLASEADLRDAINHRRVLCAIILDPRFSRDVAVHKTATALAACDGRRSNSAQIMGSYISQIAANTGAALRGFPPDTSSNGTTIIRHMFNPNLDFLRFVLPALVATVASISAMSVAGQ